MLKKLVAVLAVVSLSLSPISQVNAAVKPGATCTKAGNTAIASGKTFTCIKSGKKLVWDKGVEINKTSTKGSPAVEQVSTPKSILSEAAIFSNLDSCRISDGDPALTNMTAGFPIPEGRINLLSGAKIQIIGVDFPDKKGGVKSPKDLYQEIATQTENFWTSQSSGNGKFQWNWYPDWVNMPNPIKSYQLGGSFFEGKFNPPAYFNFAENIIAQTDKNIDFTGINFLILVFPQGISNDEIGTFVVHTQGSYRTNEGTIYNLIIAGGDYANYDTYIHEFGHAFGLTDIRDTLDLGNQKQDGMYFDVMNNYIYPELLAWHRFLLGFLLPSQVHCITNKDASTHWLTPVAQQSKNVKAVIIPLSSTRALIVESRRALGYDYKLADRNDLVGAVVYQLDTTIPYHRSPVWVIDILKENQSVINNGYKITNIESGMFGDVIKVEVSR